MVRELQGYSFAFIGTVFTIFLQRGSYFKKKRKRRKDNWDQNKTKLIQTPKKQNKTNPDPCCATQERDITWQEVRRTTAPVLRWLSDPDTVPTIPYRVFKANTQYTHGETEEEKVCSNFFWLLGAARDSLCASTWCSKNQKQYLYYSWNK